jgi:hypothetical protein
MMHVQKKKQQEKQQQSYNVNFQYFLSIAFDIITPNINFKNFIMHYAVTTEILYHSHAIFIVNICNIHDDSCANLIDVHLSKVLFLLTTFSMQNISLKMKELL